MRMCVFYDARVVDVWVDMFCGTVPGMEEEARHYGSLGQTSIYTPRRCADEVIRVDIRPHCSLLDTSWCVVGCRMSRSVVGVVVMVMGWLWGMRKWVVGVLGWSRLLNGGVEAVCVLDT